MTTKLLVLNTAEKISEKVFPIPISKLHKKSIANTGVDTQKSITNTIGCNTNITALTTRLNAFISLDSNPTAT